MTTWRRISSEDITKVTDGDTLRDCTIVPDEPGTPIFAGIKRLTFIDCNLTRAVVPADATATNCNLHQSLKVPYQEPPAQVTVRVDQLMVLLDAVDANKVDVVAFRKRHHLAERTGHG